MGKTLIEWTDASWNPIVGCTEISPGCANCYAARLAATRLKNHPDYKGLATKARASVDNTGIVLRSDKFLPRWTGGVRFLPDRLEEPLHWTKPRRIFVCDMGDLFHESVTDKMLGRVWSVMNRCRWHTFQILTKRHERMQKFISRGENWEGWITLGGKPPAGYGGQGLILGSTDRWPLPNVWCGVSVENQHFANERIPLLLQTPAAVRWISAEPLLGPVCLQHFQEHLPPAVHFGWLDGIDWLVCGGESGANARPMHPEWARSLRDQCQSAGVPFFFKQWGAFAPLGTPHNLMIRIGKKKAGRLLDGRTWDEFPKVTP